MNESLANEIARLLADRNERVVLAESCTAGLVAATLGTVPGISSHLCGSAVVYRPDTKRRWLGVRKKTIKRASTESVECAREIAVGALKRTPEADWAVGVVGHMGPDAPEEKDGHLYLAIARRTRKGNIKIKDTDDHKLGSGDRVKRQQEATEVTLTHFARLLTKKHKQEKLEQEKPPKKKVVG